MPTNLYGPNDNYDLASSHVLPALIRKAHEAKVRGDAECVVWGSGTPRREFLHVDDLTALVADEGDVEFGNALQHLVGADAVEGGELWEQGNDHLQGAHGGPFGSEV